MKKDIPQTQIRIPSQIKKEIKVAAAELETTLSQLMITATKEYIAKHKPKK